MSEEYFTNLGSSKKALPVKDIDRLIVEEALHRFHSLIQASRFQEAIELLSSASKISVYGSSLASYGGVILAILSNDLASVDMFLSELAKAPENFHAHYDHLIAVLGQGGRPDLAVNFLKQAADNHPDSSELRILFNSVLSVQNDFMSYTESILNYVSRYPDGEVKIGLSSILQSVHRGNFAGAQSLLQNVLKRNPKEPAALFALALVLVSRNNHRLGKELLKITIALVPDWLEPIMLLTKIELDNSETFVSGEMIKIISRLEKIHALIPLNFQISELLSWARMWNGDFQRGINDMREVRAKINEQITINFNKFAKPIYLHPYWFLSFGHFWGFEVLAKCRQLGMCPNTKYKIIRKTKITNRTLLEYYSDLIDVVDHPDDVVAALPQSRDNYYEPPYAGLATGRLSICPRPLAELDNLWNKSVGRPLLTLNQNHKELGDKTMEQLGVPKGSWFITLHIRESSKYYHETSSGLHEFRNAEIVSYFKIFDYIRNLGGYVVRLGEPTMSKLPHLDNVIDYAHSSLRSDWMDIYLLAKCRFMIGMLSGPNFVPSAFGVPVVYTNVTPLIDIFYVSLERDLAIPKLYWLEREQRFATFAEAVTYPIAAQMHSSTKLKKMQILPVNNTAQEILDVVTEMVARLENRVTLTAEDLSLHERLNSQLPVDIKGYQTQVVGTKFMRDHCRLLDPN